MKQKLNMAMTLAVIFSMLFTAVAFADEVYADGDNVTPVAQNPLNFGNVCRGDTVSGPVLLAIRRQANINSDTVFANGSTVTISVASVSGSGLSAVMGVDNTVTLPSNWETASTGTMSNNTANSTVSLNTTGLALGAYSGTVQYDGTGNNSAPPPATITRNGNITVNANIVDCTPADTTTPTASPTQSPAANANGWNNTDVTVTWNWADEVGGSGIDTTNCTMSSTSSGEGEIELTASCKDLAGNTGTASYTVKVDKTAPTVTITPDRAPDYGGWYNGEVNFTVSGTDAMSGVASCDADFAYSEPDSATAFVSASCTDNAGNVGAASYGFKYDGTPPTISYTVTPAPAATGWYNIATGAPEVVFTCDDATAGIESCTGLYTFGEGADQSHTGTAKDNAGNTASATVSGINVDLTAPTVALVGGPADGASYYFGFVPAEPTCTASDALSGLDGACSVAGYGTTVGSHTVIASAADKAGNTASASATYTVQAWTLFGFYQPVDMNGVWNTVKGGSTVPLKFEIFAGPTELTDTSFIQSLQAYQVACSGSGSEDAIETVATGGTSLRYDTTSGQFIYNWQTPKKPSTCYKVTMTTQDGSFLTAFFKLK